MKTGLFFGSFNPIHVGHLVIANSILDFVDEVWFVVSPQNPFKKASELISGEMRLEMVKAAIRNNQKFITSDIEFSLPLPSYTINTINELKLKYPDNLFSIITGSDNFQNIDKWKSSSVVLKNPFFIYERPGFLLTGLTPSVSLQLIRKPLLNISATEIRERINQDKSIQYLVPDSVIKIITDKKLYK